MLKGRWRCILKRNDVKLEFMSTLAAVSCTICARNTMTILISSGLMMRRLGKQATYQAMQLLFPAAHQLYPSEMFYGQHLSVYYLPSSQQIRIINRNM